MCPFTTMDVSRNVQMFLKAYMSEAINSAWYVSWPTSVITSVWVAQNMSLNCKSLQLTWPRMLKPVTFDQQPGTMINFFTSKIVCSLLALVNAGPCATGLQGFYFYCVHGCSSQAHGNKTCTWSFEWYCPNGTVAAEATVTVEEGFFLGLLLGLYKTHMHAHIKTRVPGAGRIRNPSSGPVCRQHLAHICLWRI